MPRNPGEDYNIRISLTVARYLLDTCRSLVTHLYGTDYNPATGQLSTSRLAIPSMYEQFDSTDLTFMHWVSTVSSILRLVAGILHYEIQLDPVANQEALALIDELNEVSDTFARQLTQNTHHYKMFHQHDLERSHATRLWWQDVVVNIYPEIFDAVSYHEDEDEEDS